MKSVHNLKFWGFLFSKTEDMRSKVRQNKFGENGCCRHFFIKKFLPYICFNSKAQNYRECMETKKAIFRNSKQRTPSLVCLSCEHELICLVYEGESL